MNLLIDDAIFITYAIYNLINASVRVASLRSCGRRAELSHHRGRGKHGCWMTARWAHDECVWSKLFVVWAAKCHLKWPLRSHDFRTETCTALLYWLEITPPPCSTNSGWDVWQRCSGWPILSIKIKNFEELLLESLQWYRLTHVHRLCRSNMFFRNALERQRLKN